MVIRGSDEGNASTDEFAQSFRQLGRDAESKVRRWFAAEAQLYPLIMVDPSLYEAAVTVVGEATPLLRGQCDTVSDLIDVDPERALAQCPSAGALPALGIDPTTALEAACAHRWRELIVKQPNDDGLNRTGGGDR